ncbi:MAG: hypothetical protein ACM3U2_16895 [Deltaproteobacteria bacterium]
MTDRKKPGVAFWITVVVVAGSIYVAGFGPACWTSSRVPQSSTSWEMTDFFYSPILRAWWHGDQGAIGNVISWYANLAAKRNLTVARQLDGSFCLIEAFSP